MKHGLKIAETREHSIIQSLAFDDTFPTNSQVGLVTQCRIINFDNQLSRCHCITQLVLKYNLTYPKFSQ